MPEWRRRPVSSIGFLFVLWGAGKSSLPWKTFSERKSEVTSNMDEIVQLFVQAFSATGPDANEKIQMAESAIRQYGGNPEFCGHLCEIVSSPTVGDAARKSVAVYLTRMIDEHWGDLPDQSKLVIVSSFPKMIAGNLESMYKLMMKMTGSLVHAAHSMGDVTNLLGLMQSGLQSKTDSKEFVIGLMIAKAMAIEFRLVDSSTEEAYDSLASSLMGPLTQFVGEGTGFLQLALAYQIARHLSIRTVPRLFRESAQLLPVWFNRAMTICTSSDDPHFGAFVRCAVKFCSEYFYRHGHLIPDECAINVLNSVVAITNTDTPNKILGRCVHFLKWAMHVTSTWNSISGDLISFLQLIVLPLYALDDADLNDAMNDPSEFLQNFHAKALDTSDPRSYLLQALSQRAKTAPELVAACTQIVLAYVDQPSPQYDRSKYSACHLFSAVARHADPSVIVKIASLIQHPSFIVRVGGLVALQNAYSVPGEVVMEMIVRLDDESLLVQYFAAVDLCTFIEKLNEKEADIVREACGPRLAAIVGAYFRLSQEFYDYQLIELIRTIVEFFGPQLVGSAASFVLETYKVLVEHSGCQSLTDIIASSIGRFLELLDGNNQVADATIGALLQSIFASIPMLKQGAVSSVVGLIATIIAISPSISESHWQIIQLLTPFIPFARDEVCICFKNLVIRDRDTARRSDIAPKLIELAMSLLQGQADPGHLTPAMSFLTIVLVVLSGANVIDPAQIVPPVLGIAMNSLQIPVTAPYASMLFAALLIFSPDVTLGQLGERRGQVFEIWLQSVRFEVLIAVVTRCQAAFSNEELISLVTKCAELMQSEAKRLEESIFKEDIEERITEELEARYSVRIRSLNVFEPKNLIADFAQLIQSLQGERIPGIVQHIESQAGTPLASLFENLQKFY